MFLKRHVLIQRKNSEDNIIICLKMYETVSLQIILVWYIDLLFFSKYWAWATKLQQWNFYPVLLCILATMVQINCNTPDSNFNVSFSFWQIQLIDSSQSTLKHLPGIAKLCSVYVKKIKTTQHPGLCAFHSSSCSLSFCINNSNAQPCLQVYYH